ncbi:M20/M25/M40 family metallo-hydrolase [Bacteroidales bacterium OttesenSCG-928-K03]|nr:M20/M25/M40 family metallo-hydrolase [Bacteroidales bacterium OttesenSCG-928-K03]
MKKYLITTFSVLFLSLISFAAKFVIIPMDERNSLESFIENTNLFIHYYCDDFILASTDETIANALIIDDNAFNDMGLYAIVYCDNEMRSEYLAQSSKSGQLLWSNDDVLIMKILTDDFSPAKNDGMIMISKDMKAKYTKTTFDFPIITEKDNEISAFIDEVSIDIMMNVVQRLQNFETRYYNHDSAYAAQDWIKTQYENLGLEVILHDFPFPFSNPNSSDNVIAVQYGTEFPDEYIVCGGHYDSRNQNSHGNNHDIAPGADDNATGVAGILETARILSQTDFKRSIIYCSFSAEEWGLVGSGKYAQQCALDEMKILAYFNMDMTGYLKPGTEIHIDLVYPNTAQPLANYYMNVCDIYFPDLLIERGFLTGASSDHASFNNNGFMGIFPFEDVYYYSPYIHTEQDMIGLSVNNEEQMKIFTQANIACVATLAKYDDIIGIESLNNSILIYPNPANDKIYIKGEYIYKQFLIFDINGKLVSTISVDSEITEIDVSKFPQGLYLVNVDNELIGKFVKK